MRLHFLIHLSVSFVGLWQIAGVEYGLAQWTIAIGIKNSLTLFFNVVTPTS